MAQHMKVTIEFDSEDDNLGPSGMDELEAADRTLDAFNGLMRAAGVHPDCYRITVSEVRL